MVAPVRETVSQSLASLLLHMPRRSILRVHDLLLDMIFQRDVGVKQEALEPPPSKKVKSSNGHGNGHGKATATHVWQVRHAGLLGMKYEVAVRGDLVDVDQENGKEILKGVVGAALLGCVTRSRETLTRL